MPTITNVRIARDLSRVSLEIIGSWFVSDENDPKMATILRELRRAQEEEPTAGWRLETRGEVTGWHEWVLTFPRHCRICERVLMDRTQATFANFTSAQQSYSDWICNSDCVRPTMVDPGPAL